MTFQSDIEHLIKDVPRDCILKRPREICNALRELIANKALVTAAFWNSDTLYNTMILKSDLDKQFFLLDEFNPVSGHKRAMEREHFTLRTNINGIEVIIQDNVIAGAGKHRDGAIYKVRFPQQMVYMQRRGAYRVEVRRSLGSSVHCLPSEQFPERGTVLDLSATGAKIEMPGEITPMPEVDNRIERVKIHIPDKGEFECPAEVRFATYYQSLKVTRCGVRFLEMTPAQTQSVTLIVNEIERQVRRESTGIA